MMISILLVDDEQYIVDWLQDQLLNAPSLAEHDLSIYTFTSSIRALEELRRREFDIVISDIRMPALDGLALLEQARPFRREPDVLYLTAYSDFDTMYKAVRAPRTQFFLKSEDDETILAFVHTAIKAREEEQQALLEARHREWQLEYFTNREAIRRVLLNKRSTSSIDDTLGVLVLISSPAHFTKTSLPELYASIRMQLSADIRLFCADLATNLALLYIADSTIGFDRTISERDLLFYIAVLDAAINRNETDSGEPEGRFLLVDQRVKCSELTEYAHYWEMSGLSLVPPYGTHRILRAFNNSPLKMIRSQNELIAREKIETDFSEFASMYSDTLEEHDSEGLIHLFRRIKDEVHRTVNAHGVLPPEAIAVGVRLLGILLDAADISGVGGDTLKSLKPDQPIQFVPMSSYEKCLTSS